MWTRKWTFAFHKVQVILWLRNYKLLGLYSLESGVLYLLVLYSVATVGRDSSVGIASRFGLDGPGIEFRWRRGFPHRPDRSWDPPSPLYNGYRVFSGGKAARAWHWPPTPSSAEVKARVELYLYPPLGLRGLLYGEIYLYLYFCR
jgi:hypothetical protein